MQTTTETTTARRRASKGGKRPLTRNEMIMWQEYTRPALRMMRGQSNKDIADLCGLCPSTVRRIRHLETVAPRLSTVMKILRAYGAKVTVEWP